MNLQNNAPCKGCVDRKLACWDKCEKYQNWKKDELDKRAKSFANAKGDLEYNNYHNQVVYKERRRQSPH